MCDLDVFIWGFLPGLVRNRELACCCRRFVFGVPVAVCCCGGISSSPRIAVGRSLASIYFVEFKPVFFAFGLRCFCPCGFWSIEGLPAGLVLGSWSFGDLEFREISRASSKRFGSRVHGEFGCWVGSRSLEPRWSFRRIVGIPHGFWGWACCGEFVVDGSRHDAVAVGNGALGQCGVDGIWGDGQWNVRDFPGAWLADDSLQE